MIFAMFINLAIKMYQRGRKAYKQASNSCEGVKNVLNGFYETKSTADYDVVYKGRAIAFEVKSTRFDLKNIVQHQLDYLEKAVKMGTICFIFIEFSKDKTVFVVPLSVIQSYVGM